MTLNITKDDVGAAFEDGCGYKYRMIAWNEGADQPVVVAEVSEPDYIETFSSDGSFYSPKGKSNYALGKSNYDLIARVEPRREYWANVYNFGCGIEVGGAYPSVSDAERNTGQHCLGPINITDQIEALLEKIE